MEENTKRTDIFIEVMSDMYYTYCKKNADYGDSFIKVRDKIPNAILVRLNDKLNRVETLMQNDNQQVKDESIDDTLKDLANYCVMELIERIVDKKYDEFLKTPPEVYLNDDPTHGNVIQFPVEGGEGNE